MPLFNKIHIVDILWSCTKLKDVSELPKLVPALVPLVKQHLSDLSGSRLSMVIWSLAELRQQSPDLVQLLPSLLGRFAKAEPTKLYPRDVSEVLWAIATLRQLPEVVSASDRLFKKACKLDGTFSERDVAMILWSAGIVRLGEATSAPLLQRMCKEARSTASSFSQPPQISNACLGLALSGWKAGVCDDVAVP